MQLPLWQRFLRRLTGYVSAAMGAGLIVWFWNSVPGGDNPFVRLTVADEVGALTRVKLAELANDPDWCQRALQGSTLEYAPIEDTSSNGDMCGFDNAVTVQASVVDYSTQAQVSCPMAAALHIWERDVLQPLAEERLGRQVARIEHVGTYACRRVYGGRTGEPSQHATANAIDVIGFTLDDGNVVSILNDWDDDTDAGAFLTALRDRSCEVFQGVLGPDYNRHHEDHFHLDMGPYALCR